MRPHKLLQGCITLLCLSALPTFAITGTTETFMFTATNKPSTTTTALNGSTITILDTGGVYTLFKWDIFNHDVPEDLNNGNSHVDTGGTSITSLSASTWGGKFLIDADDPNAVTYSTADGDNSTSKGFGHLNLPSDPAGYWTPVPDAASGFGLLSAGCASLAAGGFWMRRRR